MELNTKELKILKDLVREECRNNKGNKELYALYFKLEKMIGLTFNN